MIHQPRVGGIGGQASDIEIQAAEILRRREQAKEVLSRHTGQDIERIRTDTDLSPAMVPAGLKGPSLVPKRPLHGLFC